MRALLEIGWEPIGPHIGNFREGIAPKVGPWWSKVVSALTGIPGIPTGLTLSVDERDAQLNADPYWRKIVIYLEIPCATRMPYVCKEAVPQRSKGVVTKYTVSTENIHKLDLPSFIIP